MRSSAGSSLIELLAVLAIVGIAVGAASLYLRPLEAPVQTAAAELEGFLKQARARALSTTSACRVLPATARGVRAECADDCAASTWTPEAGGRLGFPDRVTMTNAAWSVCLRRVEVLLGGAARVIP